MILDVTIPIRIAAGANKREHWARKARRVKAERNAVRAVIGHQASPTQAPLVVTLTRIAPRSLDDDNLANAFKPTRDEVASLLGRDDSPTSGIEWRYQQTKGRPREYAIRIQIERAEEAAA